MYKFVSAVILILFAYRFIRYITTPVLRKVGYYNYHSPMLFTQPLLLNIREIHMGTSWDFFRLPTVGPRVILSYVAEGLLNLAEAIEQGQIDSETCFRGYTFSLKKDTVRRFGFKTRKLNVVEGILFSLNYVELCVLKSISYKKPCLVPISNIHIVFCTAHDIVKMKPCYLQIYNQLQKRNHTDIICGEYSEVHNCLN